LGHIFDWCEVDSAAKKGFMESHVASVLALNGVDDGGAISDLFDKALLLALTKKHGDLKGSELLRALRERRERSD
jgi:hypothetical protein